MTFNCTSIVGMDTGAALVELSWPIRAEDRRLNDFAVKMPAEDARALAINLLRAADAAEFDKALFEHFTEDLGLKVDAAAQAIAGVRKRRSA